MRHTTLIQRLAIAWACVMLGLQIVAAVEYTSGGSLYSVLSMVATMMTLAVLPMFIEAARRARSWGIMSALAVAFGLFLAYSLPATVGRTGEIKEAKAAEAAVSGEARKLLADELARAQERLDLASKDVKIACTKASYSDNCQGWRRTEKERQARVDALRKEIGGAPPPKVGDTGSEAWAWALSWLGISAEAIRRGAVLAFGAGLDVVIWSLMWFGASDKVAGRKPQPIEEPLPPQEEHQDDVIDWCREFQAKYGRPPMIPEVQQVFQLPKTTAWRRIKAA